MTISHHGRDTSTNSIQFEKLSFNLKFIKKCHDEDQVPTFVRCMHPILCGCKTASFLSLSKSLFMNKIKRTRGQLVKMVKTLIVLYLKLFVCLRCDL